jgi:hypothetical protein
LFKEVPCVAGFINDVVVVFEDGDGEFVAAQIFPDILDRIEFRGIGWQTHNLAPLPGIFPDYMAPIVRNGPDGVRERAMGRWGMPGPPQFGGASVTSAVRMSL